MDRCALSCYVTAATGLSLTNQAVAGMLYVNRVLTILVVSRALTIVSIVGIHAKVSDSL